MQQKEDGKVGKISDLNELDNNELFDRLIDDINGWGENERGVSFIFGPDIVKKFCNNKVLPPEF